MKIIGKIAVILLVVLVALYIGRNIIIGGIVSGGVKAVTGLGLDIGKMNIGIFDTLIDLKNIRVINPPGFVDKVMADMPEFFIDYDLGSFLGGKVHLTSLKINLKEFIVEKNAKGELNLNSLKVVQAKSPDKGAPKKESKPPQIQIDSFDLKIGKVIYKDYSSGTPPQIREFNVNIDEHYANITNPYMLGSIIISKALMNTTISSLANFDIGPLKNEAKDALMKATEVGRDAAVKAATKATEAIGSQAGTAAQDAANKATEAIKGLFGK